MVLRQDGTWLLLVVVQVPDSTPMQPHDVSGVNLEFANIAVTSDGDSMTGNDIDARYVDGFLREGGRCKKVQRARKNVARDRAAGCSGGAAVARGRGWRKKSVNSSYPP